MLSVADHAFAAKRLDSDVRAGVDSGGEAVETASLAESVAWST